jgi:hypothetical protein
MPLEIVVPEQDAETYYNNADKYLHQPYGLALRKKDYWQ